MSASPVKKNKENPFLSFESDQDPIMVAARSQKSRIRWRYCTESHSDLVPMQDDDNEHINIIALGRTGDGKSSLLNDLMGHAVFKQKASARV
jgi:predicted GTPase